MRLEKFSIAWVSTVNTNIPDLQAEAAAIELIHDLIALLSTPAKSRDASYQMTILCADTQARFGDLDGARERYDKAIQRHDLDWPEAVFEAFTTFENVHGSLETLQAARKHIGTAQKKLNKRREREAQAQQAQQAAYAQQQAAAAAAVVGAAPAESVAEPMAVDNVALTASAEAAPQVVAETQATAPAAAATAPEGDKADGEVQIKR